jgi:RNA polymerase sigma-70 factor (ECF subfamily)
MAGTPPSPDLDDTSAGLFRLAGAEKLQRPASRADVERLYRSHFAKFTGYFRRCGLPEAVAHELVQETFIRALGKLHQFDGRAQLATWVWAIARSQLLSHLRQQGRRPASSEDMGEPVDPDSLMSRQSGRLMEQGACVRRGFAAFAQQHPERAQALYLAAVEGWTNEELAEFLGRTAHAAAEYLSQCRAKLKPFIAGCDECL